MRKNEGEEGSSSKRRKVSRSEDDAQLFRDLLAKANQYAEELEKFTEEVMNAAAPGIAGPIKIKNEQLMDQFSEWIQEEIVKPGNRDASDQGSEVATIRMLIESVNKYLENNKSTKGEPEWIECALDSMLTKLHDFLKQRLMCR